MIYLSTDGCSLLEPPASVPDELTERLQQQPRWRERESYLFGAVASSSFFKSRRLFGTTSSGRFWRCQVLIAADYGSTESSEWKRLIDSITWFQLLNMS